MAKFKTVSSNAALDILSQTKSDYKVRFSFKYCKLKNNFCLRELDRAEIEKFFKKLGENEELTAHQFCARAKEQGGFDVYPVGTPSYKTLKTDFPFFNAFGHFRITGIPTKGTFRVMGTRKDETIYILLIDYDGRINYKAHK